MPPKDKKRKNLRKLYSLPVFLILLLLTVTTVRAAISSYSKYKNEDKKVDNALQDLSAMKDRESKLKNENDWLKTSRGQEELFREQYMIAKEGENVIVITDKDGDDKDHTVTTETKDESIISKTKQMIGVNQ